MYMIHMYINIYTLYFFKNQTNDPYPTTTGGRVLGRRLPLRLGALPLLLPALCRLRAVPPHPHAQLRPRPPLRLAHARGHRCVRRSAVVFFFFGGQVMRAVDSLSFHPTNAAAPHAHVSHQPFLSSSHIRNNVPFLCRLAGVGLGPGDAREARHQEGGLPGMLNMSKPGPLLRYINMV